MSVPFRYIALDLDSTLLTSDKTINRYTIKQINKIKEKVHIVLCSSRSAYSTKYIAEALGLIEPVISFNGAVTMDQNRKVIERNRLNRNCIQCIMDFSMEYGLELMIYTEHGLVVKDESSLNKRWLSDILPLYKEKIGSLELYKEFQEKFVIEFKNTTDIEIFRNIPIVKLVILPTNALFTKVLEYVKCNGMSLGIHCNITPRYIEITSNQADKSVALEKLLLEKNNSLKDVLAIGDNMNDISIIKRSGYGVAMENSIQDLKDIADEITDTNDNNGVGKILKKIYMEQDL